MVPKCCIIIVCIQFVILQDVILLSMSVPCKNQSYVQLSSYHQIQEVLLKSYTV